MPALQGCTGCSSQNSFFSLVKKKVPKFINALGKNTKFQTEILKCADSAGETFVAITEIPAVGASPRLQDFAAKTHVYAQTTRGTIGFFCTGLPAVKRCYEAVQKTPALWNHAPSSDTHLGGQVYATTAEKRLALTGQFFEIAAEGLFSTAFLVCHPLIMPEYIDKIRDKRFYPEAFKLPEPFHAIGGCFDIVMMLRSACKTGQSFCGIVKDGLNYYDQGNYNGTYYKKSRSKVIVEEKEYFRGDFEKVNDPTEKFLLLCESLTRHILTLLDGVSKFGVYLIKVANIPAPPVVKIVLNAVSSAAGMAKVIIDIW